MHHLFVSGDRLALRLVLPVDVRPDLILVVSPDLSPGSWQEIAIKSGTAPWSGTTTVTETVLGDQRAEVVAELPATFDGQVEGFLRLRASLE